VKGKDEFHKQARFFHLGEEYFWLSGQNTLVERQLKPCLEAVARKAAPGAIRILDLGCGPGNTLTRFSRYGNVYGLDSSPHALSFTRSRGVKRIFSGECTAIPIASASFDCVLALDVLEHIADDESAMREIARVLRPGGLFFFTVPAFMSLWRYHDVMYGHHRRYTKAEFTEKVMRAGLEISSCHFFKCIFFPPLWVLAKLERLWLIPRRDNFYATPGWLNRLMEALIVWECESGFARHIPFGVSLLCFGHR